MTKLKGLLLTEGSHGMISQVEGLAKALDLDFIHEKIELNNFWKLFPPKITPVKNFVFKNELDHEFNIVISCGRKSVIPSLYLKNKYKSKIINIHIQNPKVSLSNFDFIIAPEHDSLFGENVVTSKGAIHYLTNDELIENEVQVTLPMLERVRDNYQRTGEIEAVMVGMIDRTACAYQLFLDIERGDAERSWTSPFGLVLDQTVRLGQHDLTEEEVHEIWIKRRFSAFAEVIGVELEISDIGQDGMVSIKVVDSVSLAKN